MSPVEPTDAAVIARSMADGSAFGVLFDRHAAAVGRYLARRVGTATAEDLVGETFLRAFEQRGRYDPAVPDARPWLFGIATNLLRRHHRSESTSLRAYARSAAAAAGVVAGHGEAVAGRVDAERAVRAVAGQLARLAPGDRDVLLLFAWGELSYAEIAQSLDVPVGTVRSRLNRARRLMALAAPSSASDDTL